MFYCGMRCLLLTLLALQDIHEEVSGVLRIEQHVHQVVGLQWRVGQVGAGDAGVSCAIMRSKSVY